MSATNIGPSQGCALAAGTVLDEGATQQNRRGASDRRRYTVGSFIYGGFRPRRRDCRRADDHQRVFLDWHEPRVLWLVLAILLMSCTDALLTLNILATGGTELNGLMDWLIRTDVAVFIAVKIGITSMGLITLAVLVKRRILGQFSVMRLLEGLCCGYALLVVWEIYLLASHVPAIFS